MLFVYSWGEWGDRDGGISHVAIYKSSWALEPSPNFSPCSIGPAKSIGGLPFFAFFLFRALPAPIFYQQVLRTGYIAFIPYGMLAYGAIFGKSINFII